MSFGRDADKAYEASRMRHQEHKEKGEDYREDCNMCRFYYDGPEDAKQ